MESFNQIGAGIGIVNDANGDSLNMTFDKFWIEDKRENISPEITKYSASGTAVLLVTSRVRNLIKHEYVSVSFHLTEHNF